MRDAERPAAPSRLDVDRQGWSFVGKTPARQLERSPRKLADCWHLSKGKRTAVCVLFNHPFGWELRVTVDDELVRCEVFRESDPTLTAAVEWRAAFSAKGWR